MDFGQSLERLLDTIHQTRERRLAGRQLAVDAAQELQRTLRDARAATDRRLHGDLAAFRTALRTATAERRDAVAGLRGTLRDELTALRAEVRSTGRTLRDQLAAFRDGLGRRGGAGPGTPD